MEPAMYWFIGSLVMLFVVIGIPIAKYVRSLLDTASKAGEWQGGTTTLLSGMQNELQTLSGNMNTGMSELRRSVSRVHERCDQINDSVGKQSERLAFIEGKVLNGHG